MALFANEDEDLKASEMQNIINRRSLAIELAVVTVALLMASRTLFLLRDVQAVGQLVSAIVAIFFLYVPIIVLWKRKRSVDFLDCGVRAYFRSVVVFLVAAAIVFPLFVLAAHGFEVIVLGSPGFHVAGYSRFFGMLATQLLIVALPEEFYFRGYFQSTTNQIFMKRWCILGVNLGWGWVITAAVFAVSHTIITYRWWHFAIFFPALLFGYLRERTGTITAPVLFHASSNFVMDWIARSYV